MSRQEIYTLMLAEVILFAVGIALGVMFSYSAWGPR